MPCWWLWDHCAIIQWHLLMESLSRLAWFSALCFAVSTKCHDKCTSATRRENKAIDATCKMCETVYVWDIVCDRESRLCPAWVV